MPQRPVAAGPKRASAPDCSSDRRAESKVLASGSCRQIALVCKLPPSITLDNGGF